MIESSDDPIEYGNMPNKNSASDLEERVNPSKRIMVSETETKVKKNNIRRDSVRNMPTVRRRITHSSSWIDESSRSTLFLPRSSIFSRSIATFRAFRNISGGIFFCSLGENTNSGQPHILMTTIDITVAIPPRACSRIARTATVSGMNKMVASVGSRIVNSFTRSSIPYAS